MRDPSWHDARLASHGFGLSGALGSESVVVSSAVDRTLAVDIVALSSLPGFDTSAMDGWAVAGPGPWRVVGESRAGESWLGVIGAGEAVSIATGARVPDGASGIVRSEHGTAASGGALTGDMPAPARDIRPTGEECHLGDVLAQAGTVVTPALAGLAAAVGADRLDVARAPRAAVIVFGDEILVDGPPRDDRVRDALGPQIPAWLARLGSADVTVERGSDTLDAHLDAIREAAARADVVVTTGGTARGPVDFVREAVSQLGGDVLVDCVAVRPGHPMLLASVPSGETASALDPRTVPILGLPGNPQSAIIAMVSLGWPLVAGMLGQPLPSLGRTTLASAFVAPAAEHRLVAGNRDNDGGFVPVEHLGSAMLRGLASATGFAVIPPGGADAGDRVPWQPLPLAATDGGTP